MKPWIGDPVRPDGSPEVCSECDRRAFLRVRVADSAPPQPRCLRHLTGVSRSERALLEVRKRRAAP